MNRLGCCLSVTVVGLAGPAAGGIINVGPGQSIQAAINAALDGDEIVVARGTYVENLHVEAKTITLRSSDGPEVTIIRPTGEGNPLVRIENAAPTIEGFTFTAGETAVQTDLLRVDGGSNVIVSNCILKDSFVRGMSIDGGIAAVDTCVFTGLTASFSSSGAAIDVMGMALIMNCTFSGNSAGTVGGAVHIAVLASAIILDSSFSENVARDGGAVYINIQSDVEITNCSFVDNVATEFGGAVYSNQRTAPIIINSVFANNGATLAGGAIFNKRADPVLVNCTFTGNIAGIGGGVYNFDFSFPAIRNSILWDNFPFQIVDSDSLTTLTYSDIEGGWSGFGSSNIDVDPMFADSVAGDFRLQPGSPCIDAAHNWAVPTDSDDLDNDGDTSELTPVDLDGNPRFADVSGTIDSGCGTPAVVDMGAYESPGNALDCLRPGDVNGDGTVNVLDLIELLLTFGASCEDACCLADFDLSGSVDVLDLIELLLAFGQTCS